MSFCMKNQYFLLLCTFFCILHADTYTTVRGAYYYPTSSRFREIYSDASIYELELDMSVYDDLYAWISYGTLIASGKSIPFGCETELFILPLKLGLKYCLKGEYLGVYSGLGAVGAYTKIQNNASFANQRRTSWDLGGVAKLGAILYPAHGMVADLFLDYTYLRAHFSNSRPNVVNLEAELDGLAVGVALGWNY